MTSVTYAPHHLGLWLRAVLSKRPVPRSVSLARTISEPTRIRRSAIDEDMIIVRSVAAGALRTRWT